MWLHVQTVTHVIISYHNDLLYNVCLYSPLKFNVYRGMEMSGNEMCSFYSH